MTDVAELKYGFNPNDASSFPSKDYTLLDESLEWGKNLDEDKYPPLHNSSGILDKQNDYLFILKPSDYDAYNDIPADWNPLGLLNQAVTPEEALKLEREFINLLTPTITSFPLSIFDCLISAAFSIILLGNPFSIAFVIPPKLEISSINLPACTIKELVRFSIK